VLYLLPEISLTSQLIQRLEHMLGKVGVYHSKFNPAERVETWYKVLLKEYNIVVGARSAIFLPFDNLGLIIVDEEHDGSYKQQDPAPRYQARDSSIFLAHLMQAKVLLGSATPSLESWSNAQAGKFGYVEITARHGVMTLPELHYINMTQARKDKRVTGVLSDELQAAMHHTIQHGQQVILFQNRRGYAPSIQCRDCGWIPECKNCDITLTYHKYNDQLKCHYCGYGQAAPNSCPQCHSTVLEQKGAGTERVEDDLHALFPDARILRMDYDTAKGKYAHEKIIAQFADGEAEILVGTQMVTKGLDFSNVGLVGVVNADSILHYPDFRAMERAWQLLHQVSGRAGRSGKKGKVMIQISNPKHPITQYLADKDPKRFYDEEWKERVRFHYPPYNRLIHISVRDKQERNAQDAAMLVYQQLRKRVQGECLGPGVPPVSRIKGLYIREILLKLPKNQQVLKETKLVIEEMNQLLYQYQAFKQVRLLVDVDP
jgi:primosomal protein N' (replication factor Y)